MNVAARRHATVEAPPQSDSIQVEGVVQRKLRDFDLVHLQTSDRRVFVLTRHTQGVSLDSLQEGQVLRCEVVGPRRKVVSAKIVSRR
jgi:hypothetical protein